MEIFRAAGAGHLVVISSMGALRGLPRTMTTYAAAKAGIAALAEGIRADVHQQPDHGDDDLPRLHRSEMNDQRAAHAVDADTVSGMRASSGDRAGAHNGQCRRGRGCRCRSCCATRRLCLRRFA